MKTSITRSPVAFWLGVAANAVTFICALGALLATTKVAAVEFTGVIFVLTPLTFCVGLLLLLTRDRARPFPWLVVVLWFAPVFVWYTTSMVSAVLCRLIS